MDQDRSELIARIEALEAGCAQLENFAAMAAHEVLKPLVMTEAYATLITERVGHGLDLQSRRDLDAIVRISSRVRLLVEAMLTDARKSGRPVRREQVDVAQIIRDCIRLLDAEIRERDARLEVDPMPVIESDPALLSGVFSNLLSNAVKYGPRRGGDIRVSVSRSEAGWTFDVLSSGPALPEKGRDKLFEPWECGPGERRAAGAGLGLAIVRSIVEQHGGEVGVTSPTDRSNRFFFTLPA